MLAGTLAVGGGFTVMVKLALGPVQPLIGVTVIVPTIAALLVLVAVNEGRSPTPLAPKPIELLLLVQV